MTYDFYVVIKVDVCDELGLNKIPFKYFAGGSMQELTSEEVNDVGGADFGSGFGCIGGVIGMAVSGGGWALTAAGFGALGSCMDFAENHPVGMPRFARYRW